MIETNWQLFRKEMHVPKLYVQSPIFGAVGTMFFFDFLPFETFVHSATV